MFSACDTEASPTHFHRPLGQVSGFFIWRAWDFGIYFHIDSFSVEIDDNILIENTMAILPMLYGPDPLKHLYENKRITVNDTVVVAVATAEHCAADTPPAIAAFREQVRAPRTSSGGRTGIVWGQFLKSKVGELGWLAVILEEVILPAIIIGLLQITRKMFGNM